MRRGARTCASRTRCRTSGKARTSGSSASSTICRAVSDRGVRFAFAVEQVLTPRARVPSRMSLAWYAHARDDDRRCPGCPRRRALAAHGAAEPPARQRQSRRLRSRSVAAATGPARDRIRAWRDDNVRLDAFAGRCPRPRPACARARPRAHRRALPDGARYAGVIVALAIGDQRAIPEAQWTVFNRTGIAHLVSISGLHVTVFAAFAGGIAFAARAAQRAAHVADARAQGRGGGGRGGRGRLRAARGRGDSGACARSRCSPSPPADCGSARPGTAGLVWLWALAGVLAVGSVGAADAGFLAVVRRGRAAAVRSRWVDCASATARAGATHAARACAKARTRNGSSRSGLTPLTLALFQTDVAHRAGRQRGGDPGRHARRRAARADGHRHSVRCVLRARACGARAADAVPRGAGGAARRAWQQHAPPLRGPSSPVCVGARSGCSRRAAVPGRALGRAVAAAALRGASAAAAGRRVPAHGARCRPGSARPSSRRAHYTLVYDTGPRFTETADAGGRIIAPFLRAAGLAAAPTDSSSATRTSITPAARCRCCGTVPVGWFASSLPDDHPIVGRAQATRRRSLHRGPAVDVGRRALHDAASHGTRIRRRPREDQRPLVRGAHRFARTAARSLTGRHRGEAAKRVSCVTRASALRADVLVVPHHGSRTSSTHAFVRARRARHRRGGMRLPQSLRPSAAGHRRALHEQRHPCRAHRPRRRAHADVRRATRRSCRRPRARSARAIGSMRPKHRMPAARLMADGPAVEEILRRNAHRGCDRPTVRSLR